MQIDLDHPEIESTVFVPWKFTQNVRRVTDGQTDEQTVTCVLL